jgi:hypothetical protein
MQEEDTTATFAVRCSHRPCGRRFVPKRWHAGHSYCCDGHGKAARRAGGPDAGRVYAPYQPPTLQLARRWLDIGGTLDQMALSRDERDVLVIDCRDRFHWDRRKEAAERLRDGRFSRIGKRKPSVRLDVDDVMVAIESAGRETTEIGNWRNGKRLPGPPRRVPPYVPKEQPFALLFDDFLPRLLERCAESKRQQAAAEPLPNEQIEWIEMSREIAYSEAKAVREVKGYTLPSRWYVIEERPAYPKLYFDDEGQLDRKTTKWWGAWARHQAHGGPEPRWGRTSSPPDPDKLEVAARCRPKSNSDDWNPERRAKVSTTAIDEILETVREIREDVRELKERQGVEIQRELLAELDPYLDDD